MTRDVSRPGSHASTLTMFTCGFCGCRSPATIPGAYSPPRQNVDNFHLRLLRVPLDRHHRRVVLDAQAAAAPLARCRELRVDPAARRADAARAGERVAHRVAGAEGDE